MTLVNVVPQVVPNPKTRVSDMGNFLGRSNGLPAPCGGENLPKNYKNGLVDWFGRKNVTITISIHCQKCNGYPVQSWTGWTDWTDQSKLGLVTHTLVATIAFYLLRLARDFYQKI